MSQSNLTFMLGSVVEEDLHLSLLELCRACSAEQDHIVALVLEGVLEPLGDAPESWRFGGMALRRARRALHLSRDLEVNVPGIALALDLLDEIEALQARLRRAGLESRSQ